jgi:hypothetical protein
MAILLWHQIVAEYRTWSEWNEQISKTGAAYNGRLPSAIDDVSKESYVDKLV